MAALDPSFSVQRLALKKRSLKPWRELFLTLKSEFEHIDKMLRMINAEVLPGDDVFRAFSLCPPDKIRVLILGHPVPSEKMGDVSISDGLAYSSRPGTCILPMTQTVFNELRENYQYFKQPKDGDLSSWVRQGVFLLSTALTATPGGVPHIGLWKGFLSKTINYIERKNPKLIVVLWGEHNYSYLDMFSQKCKKILGSMPIDKRAKRESRDLPAFSGSKPFAMIDAILEHRGEECIDWYLEPAVAEDELEQKVSLE